MKFEVVTCGMNEVFELMAKVPVGRKVLSKFSPLQDSGKVSFRTYPLKIINQLKALTGPDQPVGACFTTDGVEGTIYYDGNSPLGVLAPFLLHEMIHALNRDLWKASLRGIRRDDRDALLLQAEVEAFEKQYLFIEELRAVDPAYAKFIEKYRSKSKILCDRLTTNDVAELYGFKTREKAA